MEKKLYISGFIFAFILILALGFMYKPASLKEDEIAYKPASLKEGEIAYKAASLKEGEIAYKAEDYITALKNFTTLAGQGDAQAQFFLGTMYDDGKGVVQDYQQAVKWFTKAAEQGDAQAQSKLAIAYLLGQGVAQDPIVAYILLSLAAVNMEEAKAIAVRQARDLAATMLSPAQLNQAQQLASAWKVGTPLPTSSN